MPCQSPAQSRGAKADAELTSAYKAGLGRISPANQELLRQSEREWIKFSDKHEAVCQSLARQGLLTQNAAVDEEFGEVYSRRDHLLAFFAENPIALIPESAWLSSDQQLGVAYSRCMAGLNDNDRILLRDSERAWIIYRDADAIAAAAPFPLSDRPRVAMAAKTHLTGIRVNQIYAYLKPSDFGMGVTPQPDSASSPKSDSTPSAEAMNQWAEKAMGVLKVFTEKRDSPFFAKPEVPAILPELPSDIANQVFDLSDQINDIQHGDDFSNEVASIKLLVAWANFTQEANGGNIEQACRVLSEALAHKPKTVTEAYAPLWQAAESWDDACTKSAKDFDAHSEKAKSLENLGKNSEAIKEYQAALGIIVARSTAEKVKKLQEQTLGL